MIRLICGLALLLIPFKGALLAAPLTLEVSAESAILINADTGVILFEKQAHIPQYPASITKIATAAYTLKTKSDFLDTLVLAEQDAIATISEEARRRSNYTVPAYWLVPDGTHIGIKKGEEMSLRDLLYGMMIASGNDASNVIAQYVGGTIPSFLENLNRYLKELGCQNTTFYNPHGLHHPKHQTTAYDMSLMTCEALKNQVFRDIVSTVKYARPKTNKQVSTTLVQTNRLIKTGNKNYYAKAIGVKTGYTSLASRTLVAAAKQGERTLVAVLLKSKERDGIFRDAIAMFETAFNQPKVQRTLLKAGPQKFILELPGATSPLATYIQNDILLEYYPAEEPKLKCYLHWKNDLKFPVKKDQPIGELQLQTPKGVVTETIPLLAQNETKATWTWYFQHFFE